MDGRSHNALATEPVGLAAAEASAWAAGACYKFALGQASSGIAGSDSEPEADLEWSEPDVVPVPAGAAGPHHAFESFSAFGLALPSGGATGMTPSGAMRSSPHDEDAHASGGAGGDGFDAFLREHRPMLVAWLARRIGEDDAQDVAQEALVRLMRYRGQPVEQLRPLMYRIAINVIHDRGRRDSTRQVFAHVSLDQDFVGLPSLEPTHETRITHEQELALVRAAILELPERCRQVYLLNRIDGLSYSQIAQHCAISVKAVEKHIGKALSLLRSKLKREGVDREERT
ncbi:RNA polymerase sigma factor [Lysobacter arvi]|uniref:RNA polymerase sigma factor n=1 Tax=Lysobacter arvi TaxID=3038776 RepID=A0ABU1CBZ8_9GAMM|nr:RNA polymerase sigma factor [Lysobacter arvi]MDR0182650.1 RNA polymerase sigma factor [Lysobacter arvi]